MRVTLSLLFLTLALAGAARAQGPAVAPPDVEVVKYTWSKERINWEANPFGGSVESFDDMRRRMVDQRRLERARAGGLPGEAGKIEREIRSEQVIRARPPAPPRYAFLYKVVVVNNGGKAIREIDWDYVFADAATGQELSRREFTNTEKIAPGKRKELFVLAPTPPTQKISVHALNRKEREGLTEGVVVMRVLYEDGTVWRRP